MVTQIQDEEGNTTKGHKNIELVFQNYFRTLFQFSGKHNSSLTELLPGQIIDLENETLTRDFTEDEVKLTLSQMGSFKAPGPDGYHAYFFLKTRTTSDQVMSVFNGFHENCTFSHRLNHTTITLIPNSNQPT